MKNKILLITLGLFAIVFIYMFSSQKNTISSPTQTLSKQNMENSEFSKKLKINEKIINIIVADSDETLSKGLGGRESIGENEGMLFDFGYDNTFPTFWMKDMNFPIDIIWIDDLKIVEITKNVPNEPADTKMEDLHRYTPSNPVDLVLEVNAGFVEANGIEVGNTIEILEN